MIKFTVVSAKVREMKGVAKASGKPYHMGFQDVYAHTMDKDGVLAPFPEKVEVSLDRDERSGDFIAHQPGEYQLHPSSFYLDREGRPAISIRLTPLKKPATA